MAHRITIGRKEDHTFFSSKVNVKFSICQHLFFVDFFFYVLDLTFDSSTFDFSTYFFSLPCRRQFHVLTLGADSNSDSHLLWNGSESNFKAFLLTPFQVKYHSSTKQFLGKHKQTLLNFDPFPWQQLNPSCPLFIRPRQYPSQAIQPGVWERKETPSSQIGWFKIPPPVASSLH